ncbi:ATP-binding protein [Candidatus Electronema sp. PJ]|uniref:ATP-binding protein n=1 Tax=Candidatus Electronema sp. PJ TaxID=3401572 RepID=UPI003AA9140F
MSAALFASDSSFLHSNAAALAQEIAWFHGVLTAALDLHFTQEGPQSLCISDIPPPDLSTDCSPYACTIREHGFGLAERLVLILALLPHISPHVLDVFFANNKEFNRGYTQFGGLNGKSHSGFLPTAETAAFLLAGNDLACRFELLRLFDREHCFFKHNILRVTQEAGHEPFFSGALVISEEYLRKFTTGGIHKPEYSLNFPAKLVSTKLDWSDLVLAQEVMEEVENIRTWIEHSAFLMDDWGLGKSLKPGFRSLFHGPPGTGKTLTASLIGKSVGADVYKIDLSMVVSKYIGETEKNLAHVFDQAENRNWILFFDEADALFGKRTQTSSSNDRYANQEISYLLQRVEDFPGTVILATNIKANIDEAFARRFQSVIYFPIPEADLRLRLWQNALGDKCQLAADVHLDELAEKYQLAGGAILNVVRYGAIKAMQKKSGEIAASDLRKGIARELMKEGKTM